MIRPAPFLPRPDEKAALARVRRFANVMDRKYRIPGTNIRYGLDPIISILPVVGDTATAMIGAYPIIEAVRLNARKRTVLRMALNLGIDWFIGLVPVIGIIPDVVFKANMKNFRLLESELIERERSAQPLPTKLH